MLDPDARLRRKVLRIIRSSIHGPQHPGEAGGSTGSEFERLHRALDSIAEVRSLNHFIVFGKEHFDFIVSQYGAFYHECRPHQGIGNVLLPQAKGGPVEAIAGSSDRQSLPLDLAQLRCEQRLGGLLKHFYRQAA